MGIVMVKDLYTYLLMKKGSFMILKKNNLSINHLFNVFESRFVLWGFSLSFGHWHCYCYAVHSPLNATAQTVTNHPATYLYTYIFTVKIRDDDCCRLIIIGKIYSQPCRKSTEIVITPS